MTGRYTDVDHMIFKRWGEVKALREAFDDLVDRMQDNVEASLEKVSTALTERGLSSEFDRKLPAIWFWKSEWATRRNEPGIYIQISYFAPDGYGKAAEAHPTIWFMTDEFSKLKMRESSEDFGRALKGALPPELLAKWSHDDADQSEAPLGRDCNEVSDADRVRFMAEPKALGQFILERVDEVVELVPAIDQVLTKMTRR